MIRVLLVDDSAAIRTGVSALLDCTPDLTLEASYGDASEAAAAIEAGPDIVLMDIRMPGVNGIDATMALLEARPGSKVIVLTAWAADDEVVQARKAGAVGVVAKSAGPAALLTALRTVAAGGTVWPD